MTMTIKGENSSDDLDELRSRVARGDAAAQVEFGRMCEFGCGVPQVYEAAVKWYGQAAMHGDAAGQVGLGRMHELGRGVLQDTAKAVRLYQQAAEQGDAEAQFNLGNMYATGRGVQQDDVSAHMWLNLAAAQSTGQAWEQRAAARDDVAARMTREDLRKAQLLAGAWKPG